MSTQDSQTLEALAARVRDLDEQRAAAVRDRDDAIRTASEQGQGPTALARATGLNVSRIYQIRDARR